ncbi:hypothetical protein KC358_g56 [Hortaea werneckii]|nr:hypothetical protein KC358_g56 [Hortaea werneckii]
MNSCLQSSTFRRCVRNERRSHAESFSRMWNGRRSQAPWTTTEFRFVQPVQRCPQTPPPTGNLGAGRQGRKRHLAAACVLQCFYAVSMVFQAGQHHLVCPYRCRNNSTVNSRCYDDHRTVQSAKQARSPAAWEWSQTLRVRRMHTLSDQTNSTAALGRPCIGGLLSFFLLSRTFASFIHFSSSELVGRSQCRRRRELV